MNGEKEEKKEPVEFEFPVPSGDAFMSYQPKTGWFWIGIKIQSFDKEGATAFVESANFQFWQIYTAMKKAAKQLISPAAHIPANLRKQ